jgi:16S rRNA processing protein RimM
VSETEDFVEIGRVVGTFGLKGALKIELSTDFPEWFEIGRTVYIDGEPLEVRDAQWHKTQLRAWLGNVTKIHSAEGYVGKAILGREADRPELDEGEYLVRDLLGIECFDEEGERLGTLDQVIQAPAQDVYRIGTILVPAVKDFILDIDPKARRMTVRLLPGFKDLG